MDLIEELKNLLSLLNANKVDYALCGGLAMAVYAHPRSTLDIDIMIEQKNVDAVKSIAKDLGYLLDAGLMEFQQGRIQIHRVTKIDKDSGEPLVLDMLLVNDETRDAWETRKTTQWDQGVLSVVSPEGLIKLKSMRNSGQDKDDIKNLRSIVDED